MAGGISVSSVSQRQQSQTSRTFEARIIGSRASTTPTGRRSCSRPSGVGSASVLENVFALPRPP